MLLTIGLIKPIFSFFRTCFSVLSIINLTSPVLLTEVREPPDVSEAHTEPEDGEEELDGAVPGHHHYHHHYHHDHHLSQVILASPGPTSASIKIKSRKCVSQTVAQLMVNYGTSLTQHLKEENFLIL